MSGVDEINILSLQDSDISEPPEGLDVMVASKADLLICEALLNALLRLLFP